jgi:adenylate cyclase
MDLRRHLLSPTAAGIAALLVLLAVWAPPENLLRTTLRERAFDLLLPLLPQIPAPAPTVVIIDIDRDALARFGPWPWPRANLADIVSAAAAGKPAALGLDILLAGPDRFSAGGDAVLAKALSNTPGVLGFVLETTGTGQDLPATPILVRGEVSLPALWRDTGVIGPLTVLADAAQGLGAMVAAADPDGPIRRVPLLVMGGGEVRPGLAVELVRVAQQAGALLIGPGRVLHIGDLAVPLGPDATLRLSGNTATDATAILTIPALRLLDNPGTRATLAGSLVLIGSSAPELGGLRVTPASPATPDVQIQAQAVEAILQGDTPIRPEWAEVGEPVATVVLGVVCLLLAVCIRPLPASLIAAVLCLGWGAAALAAAPALSQLVDPAGPPLVAIGAFAAATLARFARDEWRARLLRLSFEQHLAPEVVRRIAANPQALRLRGELREITALFTDIEGFTSLTERAQPDELIALLDAYFEATTRIVTDHGGMIDKIVGDAIHAIYNAPFALDDHPARAVATALALLEASETVRRSPLGQRLALGRTRIGIETGLAIVGDVGGSRKLDYTAHGNAMNAAARLEAANKDFGSSICIGPGTAARLDPEALRPIGTLTPRGQSQEIIVYTPKLLGP